MKRWRPVASVLISWIITLHSHGGTSSKTHKVIRCLLSFSTWMPERWRAFPIRHALRRARASQDKAEGPEILTLLPSRSTPVWLQTTIPAKLECEPAFHDASRLIFIEPEGGGLQAETGLEALEWGFSKDLSGLSALDISLQSPSARIATEEAMGVQFWKTKSFLALHIHQQITATLLRL